MQKNWGPLRGRWRAGAGPLRPLLLCEGLGQLAASALQSALLWWLTVQGGAADLAVYAGLSSLCLMVAMPLLSPWGDRHCKRRLIQAARLLLLLEALLLFLMTGTGRYVLALLCACGLLSAVAHALLLPAQASFLPEAVSAAELPAAIRLRRGVQALGGLLGPVLAGGVLGLNDVRAAMVLALALQAAAGLAAWRLGRPAFPPRARPSAGWGAELQAGLRAKWRVKLDRWWTLCAALMMVFFLPVTGLLLPLRVQSMGLSPAWCGACSAALSLGVLLGVARLAPALIARWGRLRALGGAVVLCGVSMACLGAFDPAWVWLLGYALIGLGMSVTQLLGQTHRALAVPEDYRARMAAAQLCSAHLAASLAPALAAVLLVHASLPAVFGLLALGFLLSGSCLLAVPELGSFLRLDHEQVRAWYERRYPEAFAREPSVGSQKA